MCANVELPNWLDVDHQLRPEAILQRAKETGTVSQSALKLVELTKRENTRMPPVIDTIMKDPSLASEVLRIANSPFYGQSKEVSDIVRAVIVIGMRELHNVGSAMAMLAAFAIPSPICETLKSQGVLSATIARFISAETGPTDDGSAFLAGLLSEIGAMACLCVDTEGYEAIWRESPTNMKARRKLEIDRYHVCSQTIGSRLLAHYAVPDDVVHAVGTDLIGGNCLAHAT